MTYTAVLRFQGSIISIMTVDNLGSDIELGVRDADDYLPKRLEATKTFDEKMKSFRLVFRARSRVRDEDPTMYFYDFDGVRIWD